MRGKRHIRYSARDDNEEQDDDEGFVPVELKEGESVFSVLP